MINYDALGKGRICRIEYDAEVPVKAVYKKAGIKIIKHVSTTVRTGVSYSNLPKVYLKLRHCKNKQEFVETTIEIVNDLGGNRFTTLYQNLPD